MNKFLSSSMFYTEFAKAFESYALLRKSYTEGVDRFVVDEIGAANTIVDIGSGNGKRATRLAKELGARSLTLVDNSDGMLDQIRVSKGISVIKADISDSEYQPNEKYDLVLCLWNVLGHIPSNKRKTALGNLASLLNPSGMIILDVNNRYNISQYGFVAVVRNIFRDIFSRKTTNGDFELCLGTNSESADIKTTVHLFSPAEMNRLIRSAGLQIDKRVIISYENGTRQKNVLGGQLVYKLTKR